MEAAAEAAKSAAGQAASVAGPPFGLLSRGLAVSIGSS